MPSSAANSRMLIGSLKRILISLIARAMEFFRRTLHNEATQEFSHAA